MATLLYYVVILIEDIAFALLLQLFSLLLYNDNVTVVVMLVCNSLFQLLYFFWKLLLHALNTVNTQQSFDCCQQTCSDNPVKTMRIMSSWMLALYKTTHFYYYSLQIILRPHLEVDDNVRRQMSDLEALQGRVLIRLVFLL